jgi:protein phosphatase PTC7
MATLCKRTGVLNSINLGDSGFILLRDNCRWHRSKIQQHRFNCPYQLTVIPQRVNLNFDMPSDGCVEQLSLLDGDLLVMATDGFWDNVYEHELTAKIEQLWNNKDDLEENLWNCGEALVEMACDFARDPKRESPWAHGKRWRGGKVDDTTVILATVLKN